MLIFHYASLETFKSIIENHCIWLCDIQKSNDSTERTYFEQVLLEVIDDFIDDPTEIESFSPYATKALTTFKDTYRNQHSDIPPIYSASFSLDGDLLGQWRAYANDGAGVSIGFERDFFGKVFAGRDGWTIWYGLQDVISTCRSQIIRTLRDLPSKNDELTYTHDFALSLLQFMDYKNIFYKHECFREEQEFRIVYRNGTRNYENPKNNIKLFTSIVKYIPANSGFILSPRQYRISNNRLSSYFELSFENIREHIISKIILGPKCQTDPADIRMFLKDYGYDADIKIQRSEIPYR